MSDVFEQAKGMQDGTDPVVDQLAQSQQTTTPEVAVEYRGRKWTPEDILKKFESADTYIEQLKAEKEKLAMEAQKGVTLDAVLDKLGKQEQSPKPAENTTPVAQVDIETVARNAFEKIEREKQMKVNLESSISKLQEKFGDKTIDALKAKAQELDMSLDEAKQLASTKPKAFEKIFLGGTEKAPVGFTAGSVNTQTLQPQQNNTVKVSKLKGKDYAQEVMRRLAQQLS
jgi:hypothetical protein